MYAKIREFVLARLDLCASTALGLLSAVLYAATCAGYAFPGESAHLTVVWNGLDTAAFNAYPLCGFFARLFGGGNAVAPVAGVIAVVALYHLVAFFTRMRIRREMMDESEAGITGAVAGAVAAAVFLFTPGAWSAFTHLEPRGFDLMWALVAFTFAIPLARGPAAMVWVAPAAMGLFAGLGLADTPLFLLLLPLYLVTCWLVTRGRKASPYGPTALFIFVFIAAFFIVTFTSAGDFAEYAKAQKDLAMLYVEPEGWLFVFFFATVPFLVSLFSSGRAFNSSGSWMAWFFHLAMTFVAVMAVATPLSPTSLMARYGILPVAACAFAAWTCGYLAAYWRLQVTMDSGDLASAEALVRQGRLVAMIAGGVFAVALVFTAVLNVFRFDSRRGAFADQVAREMLSDLGERSWFVTDGTLDDHLRLAARYGFPEPRVLNLICLQRDTDKEYVAELEKTVRESGVGGDKNGELLLSLSLGVLTFVQDWFETEPERVAKDVAIFGAPDLWYGAGIKSVPEVLFFGGDPSRPSDWSRWNDFDGLLPAPKGWGSYRLWKTEDPVERMRLNLRRHLGFVANNRGFWLQDEGRDDEAYDLYELVLGSIDADNVCALFNEYEMSNAGYRRAVTKAREYTSRISAIVEDKGRRYSLLPLGNYYGYVRNPEIFIRMGLAWARYGRPGEALRQVQRAIDFIPTENRNAVMNMMAALYASDNNGVKSRELYEQVLEKEPDNHDALLGLMRLALAEGDTEAAAEYLERAVRASGDDPRAAVESGMLAMMRGDLVEAKKFLRRATDADRTNLQAWSLLAAVVMQQIDTATDAAAREALEKELKSEILPVMESQAEGRPDYSVLTTKAFVLLREGGDKIAEARDAFVAAARERPDIASTSDVVLGLDIQMNDTEDAEREAREVLRRNRKEPLANYVMGSLALQRGDLLQAEAFLRRSVADDKAPVLALNDLAEVLRRNKNYAEAERWARKTVAKDPGLYVAWDTLGAILLDAKGDLGEAEECVKKACELSRGKDGKESDVRMLVSLARVQIARGEMARGKGTLRKVMARIDELSDYERAEFEELRKSAR